MALSDSTVFDQKSVYNALWQEFTKDPAKTGYVGVAAKDVALFNLSRTKVFTPPQTITTSDYTGAFAWRNL